MLKKWIANKRYEKQHFAFKDNELAKHYIPPNIYTIAKQTVADSDFFVLDFETTGLDPKIDRLLSVGWTIISGGRVQLGKSEHYLVKHTDSIPDETVAIHHITEQEAVKGIAITDVFPHLLKQMSNKILVAHFADIEVGFLQQIAKKCYQCLLPLQTIDTLQLAFKMQYKNAMHIPSDVLNLFNLRDKYRLPRYKAHNAMQDAIATAELLLAQTEQYGDINTIKTAQLLS